MKKQLIIIAIISLFSVDAFALTPGQMRVAKANPGQNYGGMMWNGSAFVPYVGGNIDAKIVTVDVPSGVPTQAQMESAVAQDLPGSMAAVQKAQSNIGVEPSNTPNQTVYNYIMGQ